MKAIFIIAAILIAYALSWAVCIGAMYLICVCFSWKFSVLPATGIRNMDYFVLA